MPTINGMDQGELLGFKDAVAEDPKRADRWPTVTAGWVGGSRFRIEFGDVTTHIGGDVERCEQSSPVGDTLVRNVSMTLEFT